jgi:transketolase
MALAERFLREHYGAEVQDHRVYAIVSDGDLMEGIAAEAASLAGQLGLGRLVYLYDDNDISLDGPTSLSFDREDVDKRFEAYGWHVSDVRDANDMTAIEGAIRNAQRVEDRPSLIRVKSIIGYPSPNKAGTSKVHGAALGEDEVRATKQVMGWDPDQHFYVPDEAYAALSMREDGAAAHAEWNERFQSWRAVNAELAEEWDLAWGGRPLPGLADALPKAWEKDKLATRSAGQQVMAAFEKSVPTMVGGAADLSESTKTEFPGSGRFTAEQAGRNVFFGVREHAMGGAVNGMAAHGGIVRPYGSTFLQFADYMRGAIRLSALTGLPVAWVYTHDSVGLGEDGPTHQPVEHLAALRAIPGLVVLRPADAHETAEAWRVILEDLEGPAAMALSRQDLPVLDQSVYGSARGVGKGAYVLADAKDAQATIVATGSEVATALAARDLLDVPVRVVSMPSWELFEQQDEDYRGSVLPLDLPTVSVEAGVGMGWERYADAIVSIDRFGASAPGALVLEKLGITPENVADNVRSLIGTKV